MRKSNLPTAIASLVFCCLMAAVSLAGELQPLTAVPVPSENPQTPEKVELGRKLFFDRRLSGDGTMNCAVCHIPDMAFADGQAISLSYPTTKSWRNTQTIFNSAYYKYLFHDGRASSLEQQALLPVTSSFEMNLNLDYLEVKLDMVPEYVEAFRTAFGGEITKERIAMALAAFERTIVSVNPPLDRYLKGDEAALGSDAKAGLALFTGKAGCSKCHYGPHLSDDKFHALLVPENADVQNDPRMLVTLRYVAKMSGYADYRNLSEDLGRYLVTKDKRDWKAFRTHSLREIARTAPYMHNGAFKTLDEVIDFVDAGGGQGNTELKPLGLTVEEKRQIKAFLTEALTGEEPKIVYPEIP
ncbi:MAG: cytochrome-c peroxidase [Chloroflexota bacterium]